MAEGEQIHKPAQVQKPKQMPPMAKPKGTGSEGKPKVLSAPSLAKPIGSDESDQTMKGGIGAIGRAVLESGSVAACKDMKPGTIKKALAFVLKHPEQVVVKIQEFEEEYYE